MVSLSVNCNQEVINIILSQKQEVVFISSKKTRVYRKQCGIMSDHTDLGLNPSYCMISSKFLDFSKPTSHLQNRMGVYHSCLFCGLKVIFLKFLVHRRAQQMLAALKIIFILINVFTKFIILLSLRGPYHNN